MLESWNKASLWSLTTVRSHGIGTTRGTLFRFWFVFWSTILAGTHPYPQYKKIVLVYW